jgi:hypothetical protein
MCIKDPINKICWKNCKDLSNGAPNIKLWNHTKKRIFQFLPKISAGHAWSWKFFFANFQILGPLGCQGWVVIPQNVKKSQNHCTLLYSMLWQWGPPYMPDIVTAVMTDDCVHLLYNSSWKWLQHAAWQPLSGQPVRYGKGKHTCCVTLLQPARQTAVLDQPSSIRPHWL